MPHWRAVLVVLLLAACHPTARTGTSVPPQQTAAATTATPATAPVAPGPAPTAATSAARVDFARDVQPILVSHCQPCHFPGGVMYERRPFDRAATIRDLGTKLFTRIKAEDERDVIRRFLSQPE